MSEKQPTGPSAELELLGHRRFQLRRRLGEGSMGAVYLAHDRERGIEVALKTLLRVDATSIYRFKREFRALSDVVHPNVVALHDLFQEGELWFFTMEYVQGQDFLSYVLGGERHSYAPTPTPRPTPGPTSGADPDSAETLTDRHVQTQPLPTRGLELLFPSPVEDFERLREVLTQISRGLLAIHSAGKLHRDLKSENVLVTDEGRAKVLDFGIVIERPSVHGTLELGVMGTPAYMSPEQAAGLPVTEATDWYSLGVMIYEALTGNVPFDGSYLEVMRQKQIVDPPPPSKVVSGVPADFDELCVSLLSRNPVQRPTGLSVLRALEHRHAPSARPSASSSVPAEADAPFVGREEQLVSLRRHLAQTDQGRSVVTLMQGPSGIGKTTLIERLTVELRSTDRAVVLKGRCYEREAVPFKAFDSLIDSLSRYLRRLPAAEAAEVLPRDIQALAHLFPVLRRVEAIALARRRTALAHDRQEQRKRAFAALKEMFCRIADRTPLVLVIDDLQWGDVDSARLIMELMRSPDAPALLLVLAYRSDEAKTSPCLIPLLPRLREQDDIELHELELGPLTQEESAELARQLLGSDLPTAVQGIGLEARGSPHLVHELVRHLSERGELATASTDTLRGLVSFERAIVRRVEELSEGARTLLELISVAGRPLSEDSLALLAASFDIELQSALLELRGTKLVRGVGTHAVRAVESYHDRVREAVVQALPEDRLEQWHRRLASTLEATGSPDLEAIVEHLIGAKDFQRAQIYAIRAATQAAEALAFDKAARLFAIAVEHDADEAWGHELLVKWADSLVNAGHGRQAASIYLEAARSASDEDAAVFKRKAGLELLAHGYDDEALPILADTFARLGVHIPETQSEAVAEAMTLRAEVEKKGFAFGPRADPPLPAQLERVDTLLALALGVALLDPWRAEPLVARATLEALELREPSRMVRAACLYHTLIDAPRSAERGTPWEGALALAERLSEASDEPQCHARVHLARGLEALRLGQQRAAVRSLERAEELFATRCAGVAAELRLCRTAVAYTLMTCLQLERLPRIEQWAREADEREDLIASTRLRLILALGALLEGERERAERDVMQAGLRWDGDRSEVTFGLERLVHALLAIEAGTAQEAAQLLATFPSELRAIPLLPLAHADARLSRARLGVIASQGDHADQRLEQAEQDVRALSALRLGCFEHHIRLVRASIALRRADRDTALTLLEAVIADPNDEPTQPFTEAVARWAKGHLVGGDDGRMMISSGQAMLREHGVATPIALARMLAVGFDLAE